ncbi:AEC family transporter [Gymnodinialimonas ceratoperidinii]|uniref:AEC family transporter n=1 Tax=Gymnodinialimonas ceratoperidinii TaxID=2856823 RepID=A0A8F6TY18_9RHOB|nr:AEC family transporter [Gymnodinialimonas ceratoperidinii]QXT39796.1 AEC family transporter [Gymnodinialimonas ceratoperidinii]
MNLALTVLEITAPVFILGAAGFVWVRRGFDYPTAFVTRLAMTLAVPCLIFTALVNADIDPGALAALSLASVLCYLLAAAAGYGVVRLFHLDLRAYWAPLTFGNTGNLGLPLALFAFGDTGLGLAIVVFAIMAIVMFTAGLWMVAGVQNPARVLKEPILWASVLGVLALVAGWEPPAVAMNALTLIGQMGIPLMLLTLGAAVARLKPAHVTRAFGLSALKLTIGVALGVVVGNALGLTGIPLAVLILQMATPVGVTSYLMAERYRTDPDAAASLVVTSTLLAIVALPITLSCLLPS